MPLYQYQSVDAKGKKVSGTIDAQNEREARGKLREQGVMVVQLSPQKKSSGRSNLKGDSLLAFTMQLSQLVNAGVPLYESLTALEEQVRGEPFHQIVQSLCDQVKTGVPLSVAMATFPNSFDKLYCSMVGAGEAAGVLGPVLEKLSQLLIKQMKLKKQIGTAMIYPAILGGFSFLIICLLLGFVVPSLQGLFAEKQLNGFTKAIFNLSHVFRNYWWLYVPVIGGSVAWGAWKFRSKAGKAWTEKNILKLPIFKNLVIQTAIARFCRTMSTLLQGGLSMIDSLRVARGVMGNTTLEGEIEKAENKIIEGSSLSQELARSKWTPSLVPRMLAVGEESGTLVVMLGKVAEIYEQELEKTLDRIMALSQPVILVVMGLVIGTVLLAILLPLTDMSTFTAG